MKWFRSPELAFWAVAVAALGLLVAVAAHLGGRHEPGTHRPAAVVPAPAGSAAKAHVDALLALMPSGIAAGTEPTALTAWSQRITAVAGDGAAARRAEGATDSDALLAAFTATGTHAGALGVHAGDPVAATALRTQIGLDVEHAARLTAGLPAPQLPAGPLDPFGASTGPATPSPSAPGQPALPQLPKESK